VVTHQLQVERRTAKAHRPKTNALPLDHATNVPTYKDAAAAALAYRGVATAEKFPNPTPTSGGGLPFSWRTDPVYYKLAVLCGNPHTENQLELFRRLAAVYQRYAQKRTEICGNKSSAVAEIGDRARAKWPEKWGLLCPFPWGS